jgi:Bacterial SH3 domain
MASIEGCGYIRRSPSLVVAMALVAASALARETTTVKVELAPGTNRQKFESRIEGDESFDYVVPAQAGDRLTILYSSDNMGSYVNVYPPGSDAAMHVGANLGNRFEGTLPETGDYRVHVYLMPNAAHRGEVAEFTIELALGRGDVAAEERHFPDGLAGGPDFWAVQGIAEGETLCLRSGPSTSDDVVGKLSNGMLVRNLGCKVEGTVRWCHVATRGDGSIGGWTAGRYLVEAAAPGSGGVTTVPPGDDPGAPALFVRASGAIEVNFKSGCGALFGADGSRISAGSSCSTEQLRQASEAVKAHPR